MSRSQSSEQSAKPDAPPDETLDTGFSETWEQNTANIAENEAKSTEIPEKGEELETRFRTMTKKGFEFRSAVKEKSARAAFKIFHTNVTAFHAFLAITKEPDQIDRKVKDLIALAKKTELELITWLELVKNTPQAELACELLSNMTDSMKGAQSATLNKVLTLDKDKDEAISVRSGASRKSRKSNKSKMSSASGSSRRSSKETLIDVKARRAALEQKLKFSDEIEEQQKILNKLKLKQELSETLAEEAVYDEALKSEEFPFEHHKIELPNETPEQMFDRFMDHKDVDSAHLTASHLLPPIINTSCVDTQDPIFPAIYSPTGIIHPVNRQSRANQQQEANIADLHQTAAGNQSILDLGMGHQANLYREINNPVIPHDHENYPPVSQPPAVCL